MILPHSLKNNASRVIDQSAQAESSHEQWKVTGCKHSGSVGGENSSRIPWLPFFFPDKDSICHWAICSRQVRISMISNQVCLHLDVTSISARKSWRQGYILSHSRPHPAKWHLLCSLKGCHLSALILLKPFFGWALLKKVGEFCCIWFRAGCMCLKHYLCAGCGLWAFQQIWGQSQRGACCLHWGCRQGAGHNNQTKLNSVSVLHICTTKRQEKIYRHFWTGRLNYVHTSLILSHKTKTTPTHNLLIFYKNKKKTLLYLFVKCFPHGEHTHTQTPLTFFNG